jgi:transcriptional regulator with XRE-family HTH domain
MATKEEQLAARIRRGYWIRRARERRGLTLQDVAMSLGYSGKSLSTPSLWESGKRPVPSDKLEPLGRLLNLPDGFLLRPPLTDDERLDAAIAAAAAGEQRDWEAAGEDAPGVVAERGGGLRRLTA